ncbi:hypothetical protein M8013_04125 [Enterobacteriaceae bacterium H4N4]|uniref:DNA utilization protein HofO C-terminal domain-containing protein n=1 Tax=Silvania confinis TaxID=2926470 RepID=A0A9J6QHV2_9ENTR|nr:hypothetical protein [Silvania confinis]MCU6667949.1 hypothetical protein [Silvania confinis]
MRIPPDSWWAMAPRWRCLCWILFSALLLIGVLVTQMRERDQQTAAFQAQQARDASANARLWAAIRKLSPATEPVSVGVVRLFSPLEFDAPDLRLVRWQPGSAGGELVVEAAWAQIPTLFVTLAQRDVAVGRFSIQSEQETLQVVIQLERQDAG